VVALPAAQARQNDTLALLQPLPGKTITEQELAVALRSAQ